MRNASASPSCLFLRARAHCWRCRADRRADRRVSVLSPSRTGDYNLRHHHSQKRAKQYRNERNERTRWMNEWNEWKNEEESMLFQMHSQQSMRSKWWVRDSNCSILHVRRTWCRHETLVRLAVGSITLDHLTKMDVYENSAVTACKRYRAKDDHRRASAHRRQRHGILADRITYTLFCCCCCCCCLLLSSFAFLSIIFFFFFFFLFSGRTIFA